MHDRQHYLDFAMQVLIQAALLPRVNISGGAAPPELDPPSQQGRQPSAYPVPSSQQGLVNVTVTTRASHFNSVSSCAAAHSACKQFFLGPHML